MQSCLPASWMTPARLALMTAVGPPDWATKRLPTNSAIVRNVYCLSLRPKRGKPPQIGGRTCQWGMGLSNGELRVQTLPGPDSCGKIGLMADAESLRASLRWERAESLRLDRAIAILTEIDLL